MKAASISKYVSYDDEWSALAYLPTNFSKLSIRTFKETIRTHKMCELRKKNDFSDTFTNQIEAILDDSEGFKLFSSTLKDEEFISTKGWKFFPLTDLFKVAGSTTTPLDTLLETENASSEELKYPYVTTRASNNGVDNYFPYYTEDVSISGGGGVLTVDSATIGYVSYQNQNFSASDHVEVLSPEFVMDKYIACFIQTILNMEQFRYSYGRKFTQIRIRNTKLFLPAIDETPDYEMMKSMIRNINEMKWL